MELTLLGTGTPSPSISRQSAGYVVETGGQKLVFDHGPGAHHRLLEAGHRAVDVTHAFFSHLHYDHCLDYPRLVLQRWDQGAGKIPELRIFGPAPIRRMTDLLFGVDGVFGPDIRARTEHESSLYVYHKRGGTGERKRPAPIVREVAAGDQVEGSGWTVTVGHASHVQPQLECLAFRIDTPNGSLCYSGDSGGICPELVDLAKGADAFLVMNYEIQDPAAPEAHKRAVGNHRDNALMASQAGVKAIVLTHLHRQIDRPSLRRQILKEIGSLFHDQVVWGEDLMRLRVSRMGVKKLGSGHGT